VALLPPRSPGSTTCARSRPASSIVWAIVVESSTGSLTAPTRLIRALSSGVNGSAPQFEVVNCACADAAWAS
jgi:hypothetical protein